MSDGLKGSLALVHNTLIEMIPQKEDGTIGGRLIGSDLSRVLFAVMHIRNVLGLPEVRGTDILKPIPMPPTRPLFAQRGWGEGEGK